MLMYQKNALRYMRSFKIWVLPYTVEMPISDLLMGSREKGHRTEWKQRK